MYAYVQNGTVVRTGDIPRSWTFADGSSISGFNLRPDLWAAEGWLPIVEQKATFDPATQQLGPPVYTVGASEVTATYSAVPRPATAINADAIHAKASEAIAGNIAWKNTVAARTTALATAKTTAQNGSTATIGNITAAQTAIRQIASMLVNVITLLEDLSAQSTKQADQNNALIRLMLGQLDATD